MGKIDEAIDMIRDHLNDSSLKRKALIQILEILLYGDHKDFN